MGITRSLVFEKQGRACNKMKLFTTTSSFLVLLALTSTGGLALPASDERDERALSLFSVVSFENDDCVAVSGSTATGNMGKCYTSSECSTRGGVAKGNCAAGFGVCCVITITTCGSTVTRNSTYVANTGFTTTGNTGITADTTCTYTINYINSDICQLRLDFQTFVLAENDATAPKEGFTATGPTSGNPPVISGTNTGKHMYVETSK